MSTLAATYPPRLDKRLDLASLTLVRAVMADGWRPEEAARELLSRIHDDRRLLRLLRARVSRAMLHRPTQIAERANATLDCALSALPPAPAEPMPVVPRQRGRHV